MNIFYKCENIIEDKVLACKWVIKPVLEISIIYFIALLSLFRANFNYIDDLGRVAQGYRNWINWSRFISQDTFAKSKFSKGEEIIFLTFIF